VLNAYYPCIYWACALLSWVAVGFESSAAWLESHLQPCASWRIVCLVYLSIYWFDFFTLGV
jgi:hypothetical protein